MKTTKLEIRVAANHFGWQRFAMSHLAEVLDALATIPLFEGVSREQKEKLARHAWRQTVASGVEVLEFGHSSQTVAILLEGTVKVWIERAGGNGIVLSICGAGEVLGEMSVLDGRGHSANVTTLETSTFLMLEQHFFRECLLEMPPLTLNLARSAMRRLRLATGQIQVLARQNVYGRVACQLLTFAEQYGRLMPQDLPFAPSASTHQNDAANASATAPRDVIWIPLRLRQTDLADLIGASRVRVNQVLVAFRKSGLIEVDRHHYITILDRAALSARCL